MNLREPYRRESIGESLTNLAKGLWAPAVGKLEQQEADKMIMAEPGRSSHW